MPPKRNSQRSSLGAATPTPSPHVSFNTSGSTAFSYQHGSPTGSSIQGSDSVRAKLRTTAIPAKNSLSYGSPIAQLPLRSSVGSSRVASAAALVFKKVQQDNKASDRRRASNVSASAAAAAAEAVKSPRALTSSPNPPSTSPSEQRANRSGSNPRLSHTSAASTHDTRTSTGPRPPLPRTSSKETLEKKKRKSRDETADAEAASEKERRDSENRRRMAASAEAARRAEAEKIPSSKEPSTPATTTTTNQPVTSSSRSFDLEGRIFQTSGIQNLSIVPGLEHVEEAYEIYEEHLDRARAERRAKKAEEAKKRAELEKAEKAARAREQARLDEEAKVARKADEKAKREEAERAKKADEKAKRDAEEKSKRDSEKAAAEKERTKKAPARKDVRVREESTGDEEFRNDEEVRQSTQAETARQAEEIEEAKRKAAVDADEAKKKAAEQNRNEAKAAMVAAHRATIEQAEQRALDDLRSAVTVEKPRFEAAKATSKKVASSFSSATRGCPPVDRRPDGNPVGRDRGRPPTPPLLPPPPPPAGTGTSPDPKRPRKRYWLLPLLLLFAIFLSALAFPHIHSFPGGWHWPWPGSTYHALSPEQFEALMRYMKDSDSLTPANREELDSILPRLLHVKRDRGGKLIIDDEFWHAIRDRLETDDAIFNPDGIPARQWADIKARLEQLELSGPAPSSQSWDSWLRNNKKKVAEILAADVKGSIIDSLPSSLVTKEEFMEEIERAVAQQAQNNQKVMTHMKSTIEQLMKEMNKIKSSSKDDPAAIAALVDKYIKKAISQGQLKHTAKGQIAHTLESRLAGRINHFAPGNGAEVEPGWSSPPYVLHRSKPRQPWEAMSFFSKGITALLDWQEAGMCWCAGADNTRPADVAISLGNLVIPQYVVVEHINPDATIDPDSMPKDLELWARMSDPETSQTVYDWSRTTFPDAYTGEAIHGHTLKTIDDGFVKLGGFQYSYNIEDGGTYIHRLSNELGETLQAATDLVIVRATSNYGSSDHTCFYRIRLYGDIWEPKVEAEEQEGTSGWWPWKQF
ncbi:hypothetical protein OQA88_2726 [Cercophora sp. LCS_1]